MPLRLGRSARNLNGGWRTPQGFAGTALAAIAPVDRAARLA
ncbi:hypothetical protein [Sphingomonas changnyeongensis]|nr:hypothetical protein [Sphingomonas changnyeongensis]